MKQTYGIHIKGREHAWAFNVKGTEAHAQAWRADGLEVWEVVNTIPCWAQQLGLTHVWCAVQDAWNWVRLW